MTKILSQQRILDLDLDLFLSDIAHWQQGDSRLDEEEYRPWPKERLILFLEQQCLLSTVNRAPGKIITHHDEAFYYWREEITAGRIRNPFEVVHADAHADMGLGDAAYVYIMGELLHKPVIERSDPKRGNSYGILPGNYLAFAIACQWISRLTYVHHERGGNDLIHLHFKDFSRNSGIIELKRCERGFENNKDVNDLEYEDIIECEPEIPFEMVSVAEYQAEKPFDLVILSLSPEYTPATSDALVDLIRSYIEEF